MANKTSARWLLNAPEWREATKYETIRREVACQFSDDFMGPDIVIPAAGADESGCKWVKKIVGAGPPVLGGLANAANGVMAMNLEASNQKQDAALTWDDQLTLPLNTAAATGAVGCGLIFEARVRLFALPELDAGGVAHAFIGMAGAWADDGVIALTLHPRIGFRCHGTNQGLIYCETDDATTDSGLITSGVTVTAAQWKTYRIDASNPANVKFFIDGSQVAAATTFTVVGAPTASVVLQPYLSLSKTSHEAVGTMYVDYVRVWHDRL